MENNKQEQNKSNSFENLKKLNSIIVSKEFNNVFGEIKSAKSALDVLCKNIKEQQSQKEKAKQEAIKTQEAVKVQEAIKAQNEAKAKTEAKLEVTQAVKPQPVVETKTVSAQTENKSSQAATNNRPQQTGWQNNNYNKETKPSGDNRQPQHTTYTRNNDNNFNKRPSTTNSYERRPDGSFVNPRPGYQGTNPRPGYQGTNPRPGYQGTNPRPGYQGTNPRPGYQGNNTGTGYQGNNPRPSSNFERKPFTPNGDGSYKPRPKAPFAKPEPVAIVAPKQSSLGSNKAKTKVVDTDKKGLSTKEKIRMGYIDFSENIADDESGVIRLKNKKQKNSKKQEITQIANAVITEDVLTVKILSERIGITAAELIKKFFLLGQMYNINSVIDFPTAELVASEFGVTLEHNVSKTYEETLTDMFNESDLIKKNQKAYQKRPPIVTVMGHVDHGKTSLLDYIKKSHVTLGEAGGITQHIGAYSIKVNNEDITFIDTPGHEAFSEMRQRGATVADIAILIVAADDGIKPQTIEAIKHIKEAQIPMIVAVNKIDKPEANIERIKQQLTEHEVLVEEWGGDTICIPISALKGTNVDKLLEMILLVADLNGLKANPKNAAQGTCIESKVDVGRGIVATIILKDGTLKIGDYIVCGMASGRIRAMTDHTGKSVNVAGPSMAVSVIGLNSVPSAGEMAYAVDEKLAKNIISERSSKLQIEKIQQSTGATLETFLSQTGENEKKIYKIIVKSDVQGTNEALVQTLEKIKNEEVIVSVISSSVGVVNESDVLLAKASNAVIIAFNTKIDSKARIIADKNDVQIKMYKIIYEAADFVEEKITKMKAPKFKEEIVGKVEVRKIFKISSLGVIAGSYVLDGHINRNSNVRVLRDNEVVATSSVENLQQQKDEAKQVKAGFECGIKLKSFNDIRVGDILVVFDNVQIS